MLEHVGALDVEALEIQRILSRRKVVLRIEQRTTDDCLLRCIPRTVIAAGLCGIPEATLDRGHTVRRIRTDVEVVIVTGRTGDRAGGSLTALLLDDHRREHIRADLRLLRCLHDDISVGNVHSAGHHVRHIRRARHRAARARTAGARHHGRRHRIRTLEHIRRGDRRRTGWCLCIAGNIGRTRGTRTFIAKQGLSAARLRRCANAGVRHRLSAHCVRGRAQSLRCHCRRIERTRGVDRDLSIQEGSLQHGAKAIDRLEIRIVIMHRKLEDIAVVQEVPRVHEVGDDFLRCADPGRAIEARPGRGRPVKLTGIGRLPGGFRAGFDQA